jgi:hypothetical protein
VFVEGGTGVLRDAVGPTFFVWRFIMVRTAGLAVVGILGVIVACATPDSPAAPQLSPTSRRSFSASASPSPPDSLHVTIGGVGIIRRPSTQTYTANISNSTATRFMYQWFQTDCYSNCATVPMWSLTEGEGLSSIQSGYAQTSDYRIFTVHVTELDGTGRAGSARFEAQGPDIWAQTDPTAFADNPCDFYNDIFYPLTAYVYNPVTGVNELRHFRRNYCDNSITWEP